MLCTLTLEAGLQDALVAHPAWRLLVPDADLIVASRQGEEEARDRYEQAVESDVQRRKHREARKEMAHVPALDVARREGSGERVGARGMRQHGLHTGSVRDLPSPGEWTSPR